MLKAQFDLSGMNFLLEGIQGALIAAGESGDARELVIQEGRLLAGECARRMGPRTQAAAEKRIRRDLGRVLHPEPANNFQGAKAGHGDVRWLYAGPGFLVGAKREDYRPDANVGTVERLYRAAGSGQSSRGKRFTRAGQHNGQAVMLVNRTIVPKPAIEGLLKKIQERVGRLRATFAYTAKALGQKRVPRWIARHFASVTAEGRAIFDDSRLRDAVHPSLVFGSRAPGIEHFEETVREAIKSRERRMKKRLELILRGYAQDHREKRPIRKHAKENMENEVEL